VCKRPLRNKVAIAGLLVLVIIVGVIGAFALGILGAPSIESIDNSFGEVHESTTQIETVLVVDNPNPIGGEVTVDIEYTVTTNGIEMAEGDLEGVRLEQGNSTIRFVTHMDNQKIPEWWVSHVNEGEYTELNVDAIIHTGLFGQSVEAPDVTRDVPTDIIAGFESNETRELNANREPVIDDPLLYLNSTSGSWGEVNNETTEIQMEFVLYNPKPYPIVVSEIGYDIRMNDISIGSGQTARSYTLPPGETTTVAAAWLVGSLSGVLTIRGRGLTAKAVASFGVIVVVSGDFEDL
jgi:LEA14-like dessication related protein